MSMNNSYMIIMMDEKIKEGNNAHVRFTDNDKEFIDIVTSLGDEIEKAMVIKNGQLITPYECKREVEVYESMIQIWGSVDPFNKKGGVI